MKDKLNQAYLTTFGSQEGNVSSQKGFRSPAVHAGTDQEFAYLRGYFPTGFTLDENGEIVISGLSKNKDFLRQRDAILHLISLQPGNVILDVGCSAGAMMVYAGLQGAEVYGQDLNERTIPLANECLKHFNLKGEAKLGDVIDLKFPDNYFDAAMASDFYEHVTDEVKIQSFREVIRVLKPGGTFVIKTPNLSYLKTSLLYKRINAVLRFQNPFAIFIPETTGPTPEHHGLTNRKNMTRCMIDAGFQNYQFFYMPLRRFGFNYMVEILSTEIPVLRDILCEDLLIRAYKPIGLSHFPG
jgi:ubiquinone/menaquinone biosynthesis C-methylase UbiE